MNDNVVGSVPTQRAGDAVYVLSKERQRETKQCSSLSIDNTTDRAASTRDERTSSTSSTSSSSCSSGVSSVTSSPSDAIVVMNIRRTSRRGRQSKPTRPFIEESFDRYYAPRQSHHDRAASRNNGDNGCGVKGDNDVTSSRSSTLLFSKKRKRDTSKTVTKAPTIRDCHTVEQTKRGRNLERERRRKSVDAATKRSVASTGVTKPPANSCSPVLHRSGTESKAIVVMKIRQTTRQGRKRCAPRTFIEESFDRYYAPKKTLNKADCQRHETRSNSHKPSRSQPQPKKLIKRVGATRTFPSIAFTPTTPTTPSATHSRTNTSSGTDDDKPTITEKNLLRRLRRIARSLRAFLRKGAHYRYLGKNKLPQLTRADPPRWEGDDDNPESVLNARFSNLYAAFETIKFDENPADAAMLPLCVTCRAYVVDESCSEGDKVALAKFFDWIEC
mmetsp:Transcript_55255/g.66517  ORF Transcript_55255/g.66517 Transcript_55255/m.66517 type:complete len:444 (-) Transcript_55255:1368-2699(-)